MNDASGQFTAAPDHGGGPLGPPGRRYQVEGEHGDAVVAARDVLLDRPVLLQRAGGERVADLVEQARFLGKLDHAGIGPVADLVWDAEQATLVLRDVGGITLAEAVRRMARGEPVAELSTPAAVTVTFLKICDILAAAHERRVVHRAIDPGVIRLGSNGQVAIGGWTAAMQAQSSPATRRFVHSGPAGDLLALDGMHEDIRQLGMCLFTALTGEAVPRTASGGLGDVDPETAARLPAPLAAVIRKAITSDAARGYAAVAELAADLHRILAGAMPEACMPGRLARSWAWTRRHRLGLVLAALILLAGGSTAVLLLRSQLAAFRAWGRPLIEEHFSDVSWANRWEPRAPDTWTQVDDRIVSTGQLESVLVFKQRLTPPLAIEYRASITKGTQIGDISLWWCEEPGLLENTRSRVYNTPGWLFQLGAYENSYCSITRMPQSKPVALSRLALAPEHEYRVRVEIEDRCYRVFVDGSQIMSHEDAMPAGSGHFALFGYFPGKAFDAVRVFQRGIPSLVSPLAVGDGAYKDGRFADAAAHYARLAEAMGDRPLIDQAIFRQGLSERRAGDPNRSIETWKRIGDPDLRSLADCMALEDLIGGAQYDLALSRFRWFWTNRPAMRPTLLGIWPDLSAKGMERTDLTLAARMRWYDLRRELFPDEPVTALTAAHLLLSAQRDEDVLAYFPDDHHSCARALLHLGRAEELLAKPWATSSDRGDALYALGRLEEMAQDQSLRVDARALAMVKLGRFDEVASFHWGKPWALLHTGHAAELLGREGLLPSLQNAVLMACGHLADAAGPGIPAFVRSGASAKAELLLGGLEAAAGSRNALAATIGALHLGKPDQARAARALVVATPAQDMRESCISDRLVLPLLDKQLGKPTALAAGLASAAGDRTPAWGGLLRLIAAAALDPAAEAELQRCVWHAEIPAWLCVARALRAENQDDRPAALAAWRAFLELPPHQRMLSESEPHAVLELVAAWRVQALAGHEP